MSGDIDKLRRQREVGTVAMSGDIDRLRRQREVERADECRYVQTLDVQYLVVAERGSLPDFDSVLRYFRERCCWCDVRVEETEDCFLVTLNKCVVMQSGAFFDDGGALNSAQKKLHTVGGRCVRVDLVVPDVYGCEVTVTQDHVEVNVGHDVINMITNDEPQRHNFLTCNILLASDGMFVRYASTGRITVKHTPPEAKCYPKRDWLWKLFIINKLIELLSPFKEGFPTCPLPVRDRCVDKCSSKSVQGGSSPDTGDCHTDVVIDLNKKEYAVINREKFFTVMNAKYPGLAINCDTDQLTLSGTGDAVKRATKHILGYIRSLSKDTIPLTDIHATMLSKRDAQNLLQQSIDSKDIICEWKHVCTEDTPPRRLENLRAISKHKDQSIISVTAARSDIDQFQQAFSSCFQTTDVVLGNSMLPHLQTASWEQFRGNLQKPCRSKIAPVLKVDQDKISICDTASSINSTRKAVLDFFDLCLVKEHPEFHEHEDTEFITDLQLWQMNFLITAQDKKQLPACFQQTVSVDSDMKTVCISAPRHVLKTCVCDFLKYVADLSRDKIKLTAASAQVLQMSDSRERVQKLLDQEGVCDWHVEQGRLVFSAQHRHMQQLEDIFTSEMETLQRALGSQVGLQGDRELPTEDTTGRTTDRQQQHNVHQREHREQHSHTSAETQEHHTEETQTESPEAQTESPETQTRSPETQTESPETQTGSPETQTESPETHAESPEAQTTWTQPQTEEERRDTSDDPLDKGTQPVRPQLSPADTVQHASCELSGHGLDLQENQQSSVQFTEGSRHQSKPVETPEERTSWTFPKSLVCSQEDAVVNITPVSDLCPPQHLSLVTEGQLMEGPTPLSASPHSHSDHLQSSVPEKNPTQRTTSDVSPQTSEVSNDDINKDIKESSPSDCILDSAEFQIVKVYNDARSSNIDTASDRQNIIPARPRRTEPISPTPSLPADLSGSTGTPSLNYVRSCVSSDRLKEEQEGTSRQSTSSAFSQVSPAGLERAQRSPDSVPQRTGSPSGPTATSASSLAEDHTGVQVNPTTQTPPASVSPHRPAVPSRRNQTRRNPGSCALRHVADITALTAQHTNTSSTVTWSDVQSAQGLRTADRGRRQLELGAGMEETTSDELSTTSSDLEYNRRHGSSPQRRVGQRQRVSLDCKMLKYLLAKLTQLKNSLAEREESRERREHRGDQRKQQSVRNYRCSKRSGTIGAARGQIRGRQGGHQNHMLELILQVLHMLEERLPQHSDHASDILQIHNVSDTEYLSSDVSFLGPQQQQQQQQQQSQHLQQQRQQQEQPLQQQPQSEAQQEQDRNVAWSFADCLLM